MIGAHVDWWLKQLEEGLVPFRAFEHAQKSIEQSLDLYQKTGIAEHQIITGESGSGKSSLCRWVAQRHQRQRLPDRDAIEMLVVSVPPTSTISGLASAVLAELGDLRPMAGAAAAKTARVITLCRECRVQMLIFDEAQHLHDRGASRTHYMIGDWLKYLIDQVTVPTVLLGLPRLERVLNVNEQLRRRFSKRAALRLGDSDVRSTAAETLQVLLSLAERIHATIVTTFVLTWEDLSIRLYYATDGRVAYVKKLLAGALVQATGQERPRIEVSMLAAGFRDVVWADGVNELNPFSENFCFRRLDRAGEPFHGGDPATR